MFDAERTNIYDKESSGRLSVMTDKLDARSFATEENPQILCSERSSVHQKLYEPFLNSSYTRRKPQFFPRSINDDGLDFFCSQKVDKNPHFGRILHNSNLL